MHFMDSPEQALLVIVLFSDVDTRGGGTFLATDSIRPVARLLASQPAGLHADGVQSKGYLIPGLIAQCKRFVEVTGSAGDVWLLHPYMLHRVSHNASGKPRLITNPCVALKQPFNFNRPQAELSVVNWADPRGA